MKRFFDIIASLLTLIISSPVIIIIGIVITIQDFHSPFYIAPRVGKDGRVFKMIKFRTMILNADSNGVDSTSADDKRITSIGRFIRAFKIDELIQILNVMLGDMSIVGPRPNVQRDVNLYTEIEKKLLTVRPGITDFSSIVFSDEGDILSGSSDPDLKYNQVIRPWKSRLGLFYIDNQSLLLDIKLIFLTAVAVFSKKASLKIIEKLLRKLDAGKELLQIVKRENELVPHPPPGSDKVVMSRNIQ